MQFAYASLRPYAEGFTPSRTIYPTATHYKKKWLGREDSNLRMRVPKTRAFPLGDAPTQYFANVHPETPVRIQRPAKFPFEEKA